MTWQQFLNVLKECDHDGRTPFNCGFQCRKCGNTFTTNRTYNNRDDMMDLYEAIERDGKWEDFVKHTNVKWWENAALYMVVEEAIADYSVWLFCLDKQCYEERCKMVAEFYGWEEEK